MRIRRKFLQLTRWTYPYGTEPTIESYLPDGVRKDENDNYYITIGENPTTMFACHLDTACSEQEKVKHVQDEKFIRTDGRTILGADDKAGMTVVLYMIEKKIPGLYYFFIGEEVGCVGSSELSSQWLELEMFNNIKKVVSFDRRGTDSIITHQLYGRCCSDAFAKELSKRLNETGFVSGMKPDDTGMMTDSAQFTELVPECTNISVGYYKEHTVDEHQDIEFLQNLCKAVISIDWETLPVERDPDEIDEEDYYLNWGGGHNYEFTENYYTYVKFGKEIKKMLLSKEKVMEEKKLISSWISNNGGGYNSAVVWNGYTLHVENDHGRLEYVGTRMDIIEYIPELGTIPTKYLSDKPSKKFDDDCIEDFASQREFLM